MRRVAITALLAYAALLLVAVCRPAFFPRLAAPVIPFAGPWLDGDVRIVLVMTDETNLLMTAVSSKLARFTTGQGVAGPDYRFDTQQNLLLLNVYPTIALTIVLAWPLPIRGKCAALLACLLALVFFAAVDAAAMVVWSGAEQFRLAWQEVAASIPASPGNEEAAAAIERDLARIKTIKSFFSTGGRAGLAGLAVGLGLWAARLPWPRFTRRRG